MASGFEIRVSPSDTRDSQKLPELFLSADIKKMVKEIIELLRFLHGSFRINKLL
jgi:hypothetical protein